MEPITETSPIDATGIVPAPPTKKIRSVKKLDRQELTEAIQKAGIQHPDLPLSSPLQQDRPKTAGSKKVRTVEKRVVPTTSLPPGAFSGADESTEAVSHDEGPSVAPLTPAQEAARVRARYQQKMKGLNGRRTGKPAMNIDSVMPDKKMKKKLAKTVKSQGIAAALSQLGIDDPILAKKAEKMVKGKNVNINNIDSLSFMDQMQEESGDCNHSPEDNIS